MTDIVFPEDKATGGYPDSDVARASDFNDAAHFAAHVYTAQPHPVLIDGGQISLDASSNTITINSGLAALIDNNVEAGKSGAIHSSGTFVVDFDARTVSITNGFNEIYLTIDLSNNDTVSIEVVSDGSNPSLPSVKIGEVDTSTTTVSDQWYLLTDDGTLSFPDADSATNALSSLPTGVSVIDRANNTRITDGTIETSGFGTDATESIQDIVNELIVGKNDVDVTYDDANNQLSIDVSTLSNEVVEDTVSSLVASDSNLSWSYDDPNDTLTISLNNSISVNTLETDNFGTNATESIQDIVGGLVVGQNDANVTYDDTNDQLSIDVSTLTNEEVQDTIASFVASDSNLSWSYDDTNNTLTVSLNNSISVNTLETNSFGNSATESIQDIVGALVVGQNDANVTYDDTNDQLSIDVSTLTNEEVQDTVASFVSSDSNLSWSYDDTNNTLTVSLSDSISANTINATNKLGNPTYSTLSDVPTNFPEGTQVYVKDENSIYVEDGT